MTLNLWSREGRSNVWWHIVRFNRVKTKWLFLKDVIGDTFEPERDVYESDGEAFQRHVKIMYGCNISLSQAEWYVSQKRLLAIEKARQKASEMCGDPPSV